MITVPCPNPTDAGPASFLNSKLRRAFHNQMPQPVIAVEKCSPSFVVYYSNVRPGIDPAVFNLGDVLLQPEDPMGIATVRIRRGHQLSYLGCILRGNSYGFQRARDKYFKLGDCDGWMA